MSGFKKEVNEGQAAEKNKPNKPNWKKLALIISPFLLILLIVVIVIFSQNGKSNESQTVDNQAFESIIAPCPFRRVDDTLAFLRLQLDSLYTVADTRERKAQQYDCICLFLPQAKAEGRLTIAEEGGNSRNKLITHLQSPAAKCLKSLKIEFEPENGRPQNVLIEAALTNQSLFQISNRLQ